jgi:Ca2+-binding EF-hand superfamily protein
LDEEGGAVMSGGFTEDEIQNLRDIFDLFDKEKTGRIDMRDLEAIMTSL